MFESMIQLENSISAKLEAASQNPPKEVALLEAFKPFAPRSREKIDRLIKGFHWIETIKSINAENALAKGDLKAATVNAQSGGITIAGEADASLHEDGVYDVDDGCVSATRRLSPKFDMMTIFAVILAMRERACPV